MDKALFTVAKSSLTLCDPMHYSTPGFPVLHCLLELAQIHVHWVGDAIQPSHPLLPSSPPGTTVFKSWSFAVSCLTCYSDLLGEGGGEPVAWWKKKKEGGGSWGEDVACSMRRRETLTKVDRDVCKGTTGNLRDQRETVWRPKGTEILSKNRLRELLLGGRESTH